MRRAFLGLLAGAGVFVAAGGEAWSLTLQNIQRVGVAQSATVELANCTPGSSVTFTGQSVPRTSPLQPLVRIRFENNGTRIERIRTDNVPGSSAASIPVQPGNSLTITMIRPLNTDIVPQIMATCLTSLSAGTGSSTGTGGGTGTGGTPVTGQPADTGAPAEETRMIVEGLVDQAVLEATAGAVDAYIPDTRELSDDEIREAEREEERREKVKKAKLKLQKLNEKRQKLQNRLNKLKEIGNKNVKELNRLFGPFTAGEEGIPEIGVWAGFINIGHRAEVARRFDQLLTRFVLRSGGIDQEMRQRIENLFAQAGGLAEKIDKLEGEIGKLDGEIRHARLQVTLAGIVVSGNAGPALVDFNDGGQRSTLNRSDRLYISSHFKTGDAQELTNLPTFNLSTNSVGGNDQLSAWLKARISGQNVSQAGARRNGHAYEVAAGLKYKLSDRVDLGASIRHKRSNSNSGDLASDIDTGLIGLALYSQINLLDQLNLTLLAAYEHAANRIKSGGNKGKFGFDSFILSARLARRFDLPAGWWIEPNGTVSWSTTSRDAYTDSGGNAIAGGNSKVGLLAFGPRVGVTHSFGDGQGLVSLSPSLGVSGTWYFERPRDRVLANGTNLPVSDSGITVDGSLAFNFANRTSASISGSYSALSDNVETWSLSGGVDFPLSDLTGSAESAGLLGFSATTTPAEPVRADVKLQLPF